MRRTAPACLIVILTVTSARAQSPRQEGDAPAGTLRAALTNDVIKQAVTDTLTGDKKHKQPTQETVLGAERVENFGREFSEAKVPDCLHADGLKRQPTFFLAGILALPFVLVAAARGKCH
jgi:hypothetical protein